jgi:hypothetical protein
MEMEKSGEDDPVMRSREKTKRKTAERTGWIMQRFYFTKAVIEGYCAS